MRTRIALTLALMVIATPALAQNLCGVTPPNNPALNNPYTVQFGWDGKDTESPAADVDPATVQVKVTRDGVVLPLVPLPAPTGAPIAGCNWYVLTGYTSPKGARSLTSVELVIPDGVGGTSVGAATSPFAFGIKGKPPTAAQRPQAKQ